MGFWRFLGWNLLGAMIWCTLVVTIGYLVGDELEWVAKETHRAFLLIGLAIVVSLAAAWWFWWRERRPPAP